MNKISILGVDVSTLKKEEYLAKIKEFLISGGQHFIATPNPEIILLANQDEELFYILNSAALSLPDGIGLKFGGWLSGRNLERFTGVDFAEELLKIAEVEKKKVGVLLWENGLSSEYETEQALKKKYPTLDFVVAKGGREKDSPLNEKFLAFQPEIVLVGFGSPWQEKFIYHHLSQMLWAKILVGVGGTFDFLTGRRRRAPKFFRMIGLEWFWRLLFSPQKVGQKRVARVKNAAIIFPLEILRRNFFHPFFYRPSVACLLYKKDKVNGGVRENGLGQKDKYKIFIVERQDEPGHWQLPQGGTDGEKLLIAGARELREEINTDKFIGKRVYKNIYRYKFGNRPGETDQQAQSRRKHTGYKGQSQGLFIAEFTGRDEDIKVNFWDHSAWKWVDSEKLVDEVHLIRKRATQRFLKKFKEFMKQK
jgi:N-acetylglucosaminyldiphosphoundecaprenol N-acetyl-beta-D-mannosaminyltransferase